MVREIRAVYPGKGALPAWLCEKCFSYTHHVKGEAEKHERKCSGVYEPRRPPH